jgi:multidrug efflux pump subunit AcrA (membrane-fusion protein)
LVQSGQQVAEGQLLLVLENLELVRDVADLRIKIDQSELRGRQHEQKGERAAKQAEAKNANRSRRNWPKELPKSTSS